MKRTLKTMVTIEFEEAEFNRLMGYLEDYVEVLGRTTILPGATPEYRTRLATLMNGLQGTGAGS